MEKVHTKSLVKVRTFTKPKRMWWSFPELVYRPDRLYKLLHEVGGGNWRLLEVDPEQWSKCTLSYLKSTIWLNGWDTLNHLEGIRVWSPITDRIEISMITPITPGLYLADTLSTGVIHPETLYLLGESKRIRLCLSISERHLH